MRVIQKLEESQKASLSLPGHAARSPTRRGSFVDSIIAAEQPDPPLMGSLPFQYGRPGLPTALCWWCDMVGHLNDPDRAGWSLRPAAAGHAAVAAGRAAQWGRVMVRRLVRSCAARRG